MSCFNVNSNKQIQNLWATRSDLRFFVTEQFLRIENVRKPLMETLVGRGADIFAAPTIALLSMSRALFFQARFNYRDASIHNRPTYVFSRETLDCLSGAKRASTFRVASDLSCRESSTASRSDSRRQPRRPPNECEHYGRCTDACGFGYGPQALDDKLVAVKESGRMDPSDRAMELVITSCGAL